MKRYCKNIKLDKVWIEKSMHECLTDKWNRMDVAEFLASYSNDRNKTKLHKEILADKKCAYGLIEAASEEMRKEIQERRISFPKIEYSMRVDGNCGKVREIGVESIKQQIYDYVAVNALSELFNRKIGRYQCASIPGRGQVYGKKAIEKWIRKNPKKARVAAKGDVHHCYPSIDAEKLIGYLKKQVKNDDLLYLVEVLVKSYKKGLSIGSYLSQWLCNYFLSKAYNYAEHNLYKERKTKNGTVKRVRLIYKHLFYMDDILILGSRKADVKRAMKLLVKFFKTELDLDIKPNWKLFQIDYVDADGKRHGDPIDMMGYKIYRDHTEARRNIFLKSRRTFAKARKQIKLQKQMTLIIAYRCVSYFGWYKNSDSINFRKKYGIDELMKYAKRRISNESKIHRRTAGSVLATTG